MSADMWIFFGFLMFSFCMLGSISKNPKRGLVILYAGTAVALALGGLL